MGCSNKYKELFLNVAYSKVAERNVLMWVALSTVVTDSCLKCGS
jgi:hypothetical protein